jgi:hypothetical protein
MAQLDCSQLLHTWLSISRPIQLPALKGGGLGDSPPLNEGLGLGGLRGASGRCALHHAEE